MVDSRNPYTLSVALAVCCEQQVALHSSPLPYTMSSRVSLVERESEIENAEKIIQTKLVYESPMIETAELLLG